MPGVVQKSQQVLGVGSGDSGVFEFQEGCNAKVTEPREHLPARGPAQLKPLYNEFWWSRTLTGKQYYQLDQQKKVQKLMLSFPIVPPSATHTVSRNSNSIPDLMLLEEWSPPAPPQSLSLLLPSPVPGAAIQPWLSRASPETHTHRMFTVPKPQTHKHKPHPDLCHTTQIKCRMQHFALFLFPICLPMGSHTTGGRAQPATGHNDTISQNSTKDFPQLIPLVFTPRTQELSLPPWLYPSMVLGPWGRSIKCSWIIPCCHPARPMPCILWRICHSSPPVLRSCWKDLSFIYRLRICQAAPSK